MVHRVHVGLGFRACVDVEALAPWSGRTIIVKNVRPGPTLRVRLPR